MEESVDGDDKVFCQLHPQGPVTFQDMIYLNSWTCESDGHILILTTALTHVNKQQIFCFRHSGETTKIILKFFWTKLTPSPIKKKNIIKVVKVKVEYHFCGYKKMHSGFEKVSLLGSGNVKKRSSFYGVEVKRYHTILNIKLNNSWIIWLFDLI